MKVSEYRDLINKWDLQSKLTKKARNYINLAITNRNVVDKNAVEICDYELESFKNKKFKEFNEEVGKVTGITKKTQIKLFNEAFRDVCLRETGWIYLHRQYRTKFCMELDEDIDNIDTEILICDFIEFCRNKDMQVICADLSIRMVNFNELLYKPRNKDFEGVIAVDCLTEKEFIKTIECLKYFADGNSYVYKLKIDWQNYYCV